MNTATKEKKGMEIVEKEITVEEFINRIGKLDKRQLIEVEAHIKLLKKKVEEKMPPEERISKKLIEAVEKSEKSIKEGRFTEWESLEEYFKHIDKD